MPHTAPWPSGPRADGRPCTRRSPSLAVRSRSSPDSGSFWSGAWARTQLPPSFAPSCVNVQTVLIGLPAMSPVIRHGPVSESAAGMA